MTTLRQSLIHLAHNRPDLRPHLLPLFKEATDLPDPEVIVGQWEGRMSFLLEDWLKDSARQFERDFYRRAVGAVVRQMCDDLEKRILADLDQSQRDMMRGR